MAGEQRQVTVVFIDIDGTLVGDVTPQVCEWEVLRHAHPRGIPAFKKQLVHHLQAGLLRPGVADCLQQLAERFAPAEFFLYTAAEATWAACIVGCIEQVLRLKFQRPIFARKQCIAQRGGSFTKSPSRLLPKILAKVHARHPQARLRGLQDNYVMVDNNTVMAHDRARLVLCPTYAWTDWYDCLRAVPEDRLAAGYRALVPALEQYGLLPHGSLRRAQADRLSYDEFKALFFAHLARQVEARSNKRTDDFWRVLGDTLCRKASSSSSAAAAISDRAVQETNRSLQRRFRFGA